MWRIAALSATLLAALSIPAQAALIEVSALNKTSGEALADFPLTITVLKGGGAAALSPVRSVEVRTDSRGIFSGEVDTSSGTGVTSSVNFRGVEYRSESVELKGPDAQGPARLQVAVYDITDNGSSIVITNREIIVKPLNEGNLTVYDIMTVENRGNKTYIGTFNDEIDATHVLYIPISYGTILTNVQGLSPSKVLTLGQGIVTQDELPPGSRQITFQYMVKSDIGLFDMTLPWIKEAPPTEKFSFYFSNKNTAAWKTSVSGMKKGPDRSFGPEPYSSWSTRKRHFKIRIYGPTYKGTSIVWIFAMLLSIALSTAGFLIWKRHLKVLNLRHEKARVDDLIERLGHETRELGNANRYEPAAKALARRQAELEARLDEADEEDE